MDALSEDLKRWFKEKWVDISRKDKSGKHPPCGRKKSSKKGYPKCRPSVRVSSETPETTGEMSGSEKKAAVRQKRSAEAKKKRKGKKPIMTSHHNIKESFDSAERITLINFALNRLFEEDSETVKKSAFERMADEAKAAGVELSREDQDRARKDQISAYELLSPGAKALVNMRLGNPTDPDYFDKPIETKSNSSQYDTDREIAQTNVTRDAEKNKDTAAAVEKDIKDPKEYQNKEIGAEQRAQIRSIRRSQGHSLNPISDIADLMRNQWRGNYGDYKGYEKYPMTPDMELEKEIDSVYLPKVIVNKQNKNDGTRMA